MSILFNPSRVHVELSSKCTLKCPRCPRTEVRPENLNQDFSLADFKTAFDTATLFQLEYMLFCGDIGDPIYNKEFLDICRYAKTTSPGLNLEIVTNGSYKTEDWWKELASILNCNDYVTFSVDGWDQESNEKYRVNSDFDSILLGIKTLNEHSRCKTKWSTIIFSFNEFELEKIKSVAASHGVEQFITVDSTKFGPNYEVNGVDPLMPTKISDQIYEQKITLFMPNKTTKVFEISPQKNRTPVHDWARCLNNEKELFINVEGYLFPCPWFNSAYLENSFVQKYKEQLNVKERSMLEILRDPLWEELYTMFTVAPLEICRMKCVR